MSIQNVSLNDRFDLTKSNVLLNGTQALVRLMLMRDQEGRLPANDGLSGDPRVVVVIDELADLLMMTGKQAQQSLTRLAQRGREAGIHLIVCTQKPVSQVLGSLAKANFPLRLVGQVTSPEEAKVATGYAGTGAERLRGPGDFMAVTGGQVTRFQAAYITARELADVASQKLKAERGQWAQVRPGPAARRPTRSLPQSRLRRVTDNVRRWLQGR